MLLDNAEKKTRMLILCTGNSARSIMVESLFASLGGQYFEVESAGSCPTGKVNPFALEQIRHLSLNHPPRSKSWDEFSKADSPPLDIVMTVCGNAACEICPTFPGGPRHVHWGVPDPAAVTGSDDDIRRAFRECFQRFQEKVLALIHRLDSAENEHKGADYHILVLQEMAAYFEMVPSTESKAQRESRRAQNA